MKSDTINCPCCGQVTAPTTAVVVDLNENVLRYAGHSLKLVCRLAEVAHILARRMPATVPMGDIIVKMWGGSEAAYADTNVKVAITQLRKTLRPIGLDIINTHSIGYRMAELSQTMRVQYSRRPFHDARA